MLARISLAVAIIAICLSIGVTSVSRETPSSVPGRVSAKCSACVYKSADLAFEDTSDGLAGLYLLGIYPFLPAVDVQPLGFDQVGGVA